MLAQHLLPADVESGAGIDAAQGAKEETRQEVGREDISTNGDGSCSSEDGARRRQDLHLPGTPGSANANSSDDASGEEDDASGGRDSTDGRDAQQSFNLGEPDQVRALHAEILKKCRDRLKEKIDEWEELHAEVDKSLKDVHFADLTQKATALANTGIQAGIQAALQTSLQPAVTNDEDGSGMNNIVMLSVVSVSLNVCKDVFSLYVTKKLVAHNKMLSRLSHLDTVITHLEDLVDEYEADMDNVLKFRSALREVEKKNRTFMVQQQHA